MTSMRATHYRLDNGEDSVFDQDTGCVWERVGGELVLTMDTGHRSARSTLRNLVKQAGGLRAGPLARWIRDKMQADLRADSERAEQEA